VTDTVSVGPGTVARLIVAEGDGDTLVINTGPSTVFFGSNNAIRATDASGIVPITPNSYFGVNGKTDLYACVSSGQSANLNIISGGLNFFLPLSSLTIPYGSTGERIVINPPAYPGSIVGYNAANAVEFIISANGYLLYDATGGALNHLFVAIQNAAGSDSFANPFSKGINIGPNTGPQVLLSGGNPAVVSFPLNDAAFATSPAMFALISSAAANRYAQMIINSPVLPAGAHGDYVSVGLNSPNADGSSTANAELDYIDSTGASRATALWDYQGFNINICQGITAINPAHVNTAASPAIAETWHLLRPLQNSFIGTIAGKLPAQYRKCADGDVEIAGTIRTPPTAGNYNSVTWGTVPAAYTPNHTRRILAANIADGAATPVLTITSAGALQFNYLPASLAQSDIEVFGRYPLDNTGMIQS
jgi:hypothetical protein